MLEWESTLRYLKDKLDAIRDKIEDAYQRMRQEPDYDVYPVICDTTEGLNTIRDVIGDTIENMKKKYGMSIMPKSERVRLQNLRYLQRKVYAAWGLAKDMKQDVLRSPTWVRPTDIECFERELDDLRLILAQEE